MKKKAYESDPLPITMNEYSYRSGKRDFIIIEEKEEKKFKNNTLRKLNANQLAKLNSSFEENIGPSLQKMGPKTAQQITNLLTKLYLIENKLKVVQTEKDKITAKALSKGLSLIHI